MSRLNTSRERWNALHEEIEALRKANLNADLRTMPAAPAKDASFAAKCFWLIQTHGYCAYLNRVVQLYEPSDKCQLTLSAFRLWYLPWHEVSFGPRGGRRVLYATEVWSSHPKRPSRPSITSIQMHRPFPIDHSGGPRS